jgi:hypothetical protein
VLHEIENKKYSSKLLGRLRILYLLTAIALFTSTLYLIYFIKFSLKTALFIEFVAIILYGLTFLFIHLWNVRKAKILLFTVYIAHMVLLSWFALPKEAGVQYFLFAVPPLIFLSSEYKQYQEKIFFTAISIFLFLFTEIVDINYFSLLVYESRIRILFITTMICLQLGVTFAVFLFTYELNKYEIELNHNIAELIRNEREREKLINDLNNALENIKQLTGLLPICQHCKKIRDDSGYWNQIEVYIQDHSEAEFSHSICQECAAKYYPDMDLYGDEETQD